MATMSGRDGRVVPPRRTLGAIDDDDLFTSLVVSNPPQARAWLGAPACPSPPTSSCSRPLVLVPLFWPEPSARAPRLHPGPPLQPAAAAAAAAPQGLGPGREAEAGAARRRRTPKPQKPEFTAPIEKPEGEQLKPEASSRSRTRPAARPGATWAWPKGWKAGSRAASSAACPGGVLGGVIGGTGDGPVMDYDQPPRADQDHAAPVPAGGLRQEDRGHRHRRDPDRLARARGPGAGHPVGPALDAAALQTVNQWVFAPADQARPPGRDHRPRPRHLPASSDAARAGAAAAGNPGSLAGVQADRRLAAWPAGRGLVEVDRPTAEP